MQKILLILWLIFSRVPLSRFQFLLLLCLIEIETGFLIGDWYWLFIFLSYVLMQWTWYSALRGGRIVWQ